MLVSGNCNFKKIVNICIKSGWLDRDPLLATRVLLTQMYGLIRCMEIFLWFPIFKMNKRFDEAKSKSNSPHQWFVRY